MLIINNTKVFPARLTGFKKNGGKVEILLVRKKNDRDWEVLSKGGFTGPLQVSEELQVDLLKGSSAQFRYSGDFMDILWRCGNMPIPPYIKRQPDQSDKERYQTIFAKEEGSIAAPTAGLHFTDSLLRDIAARGVKVREVTLHVGVGTFKPIRADNVDEHAMDEEYFELDQGLLSEIGEVKAAGKKIVTVGTTATRALEGYASGRCSVVSRNGKLKGRTNIFIYPGYAFKVIDALITNFHMPRSTPLMLVSALTGRENLLAAYREAIAGGYRFLSYGDAMLIL
jgi:S-adenosylmethionine:tRNA ribosyltransferase-isomerase